MSKIKADAELNIDWDVGQYRHEWDSDEQWEVRREFMLAHKDTFQEDELVCLAQVYANIEFMGCSYSEEVMNRVESLAEGLSKDHRERKQQLTEEKELNASGSKRPISTPSPQQSKYQRFAGSNSNRSSAASYFGSNPSGNSYAPQQQQRNDNFANNYQTQSYYTSGYKSNQDQRNQNWGSGAAEGGPDQRRNWTTGNDQITNLTQTFQKLCSSIESNYREHSNGYNCLTSCAKRVGLNVRFERRCDGKTNSARLYVGEVLALTSWSTSKKKLVSDSVSKLFEIFTTKSWRLFRNESSKTIELSVLGDKRNKPIAPEPSFTRLVKTESLTLLHNVLRDFVIVDHLSDRSNKTAARILSDSANFMRRKLKFVRCSDQRSGMGCRRFVVQLEGVVLGDSGDTIGQRAKEAAARAALNRIRPMVCTLQVTEPVVSNVISRRSVMCQSGAMDLGKAIDEDNMGNKLLRMMGWSGGGLGKHNNKGITEPIKVQSAFGRQGLGLSNEQGVTKEFVRNVTRVISNYANSDSNSCLVFSSEFSHEERARMHEIAYKFHLKGVSNGKGDKCYLVIKRPVCPKRLLESVRQAGGAIENYRLIPPSGITRG